MARACLGWGIRELARAAKVSVDTVVRFERGEELRERTVEALQRAFEAAGVEFTNGGQPGVQLTKVATHSAPTPASNRRAAANAVRRKTARATEKK
jgi:transcriptional regulator with XRE-family HTH domain